MIGWLRARSPLRPVWRIWSKWLIAPRCLFCNQAADLGDLDLCSDCLISLPWAESFNGESIAVFRAGIKSLSIQVPLWYAPPIDAALRDLKFHGDLAPARVFGAVLAARAAIAGDLPDLIVPVPLHRGRLHERGYNQAAQLARSTADWLGRPCAPRLLERRRATVPQTSLDAPARRRNLVGAFVLGADAGRWLRDRPALAFRRLALVDDVLTTGATLAAAAEALGSLGSLSIWAVARPMSSSFTSPVTPG
ncbi:MAG: ComF family protein [Sinobacteraceae bacterium]|nr:ComF family protein [Nevskiaceae bacterium]MCP5466798.1 ComF family protein [Nevskiaceae bacterium]MCP5470599.1 ComF family protein [Nevskiaceae bacterium]